MRQPRPPSLLDALAPIVVLIGLLALTIALFGMSTVLGLDEAITAGAVICGAYFGDKMTPLSETTILVPRLVGGGLTVGQHVRNMIWTAGPALGISLVIFLILGRNADGGSDAAVDEARAALASAFDISVLNLLPLLLLVALAVF